MNKKRNEYYSLAYIKRKFRKVKDVNRLSKQEFDIICEGFVALPKDIAKKVEEKIYIAVLSSSGGELNPAAFINKKDLENKEGIIFLAPSFFKYDSRSDLMNSGVTPGVFRQPLYLEILHEVAHFREDHRDTRDTKIKKRQEDEAKKIAREWFNDYFCK